MSPRSERMGATGGTGQAGQGTSLTRERIAGELELVPQRDEMVTSDDRGNSESTSDGAQLTILIVEDVPMIHDVIARTLRDLDPGYVSTSNGLTALGEIERALPDLIILDLALPIMDGWEVLRRLGADPRTAAVPVLVITAHGQSGLEEEVRALGANAFLDKPFQPKALRKAVYDLLGIS